MLQLRIIFHTNTYLHHQIIIIYSLDIFQMQSFIIRRIGLALVVMNHGES